MYGLGTYLVADPDTGQTIDCDSWANIFNLTCWGGNSITGAGTGPYAGNTAAPTVGDTSVQQPCTLLNIFAGSTSCTPPTLASIFGSGGLPTVLFVGAGIFVVWSVIEAVKK